MCNFRRKTETCNYVIAVHIITPSSVERRNFLNGGGTCWKQPINLLKLVFCMHTRTVEPFTSHHEQMVKWKMIRLFHTFSFRIQNFQLHSWPGWEIQFQRVIKTFYSSLLVNNEMSQVSSFDIIFTCTALIGTIWEIMFYVLPDIIVGCRCCWYFRRIASCELWIHFE